MAHLADPKFQLATAQHLGRSLSSGEQTWAHQGVVHHLYGMEDDPSAVAVLLPLDCLFDIRLQAARRLWRALIGKPQGANPAALTAYQRKKLTWALRALDGRLDGVSYRDIAVGLFGAGRIPARSWKTHDLRGKTIRLVNRGVAIMRGGYRDLLLYPYRQGITSRETKG